MSTTENNVREKLSKTRPGLTHKFGINHVNELTGRVELLEYYVTTGEYADGRVGEIFVKTAQKDDALFDQLCRSLSLNLQYGVTTAKLVDLFGFVKFEPAGMTTNEELPMCSSPIDYLVRWLDKQYGGAK